MFLWQKKLFKLRAPLGFNPPLIIICIVIIVHFTGHPNSATKRKSQKAQKRNKNFNYRSYYRRLEQNYFQIYDTKISFFAFIIAVHLYVFRQCSVFLT